MLRFTLVTRRSGLEVCFSVSSPTNQFQFVSAPLTTIMPSKSKVFAVIHIGSPCAGMNAATFSFVRMANHSGIQVLGIKNGWDGLKNGDVKMLTWENVQGWAQAGGSMLGAKRQLPSDMDQIAEGLNTHNVDGLLIIGGFMAFQSALIFQKLRGEYTCLSIPIVVIPATISNNCPGVRNLVLGSFETRKIFRLACHLVSTRRSMRFVVKWIILVRMRWEVRISECRKLVRLEN